MKNILFGAGYFSTQYFQKGALYNPFGDTVLAIADNSDYSFNSGFHKKIKPSEIPDFDYDYVLITIAPNSVNTILEIYKQLLEIGVPEEKIVLLGTPAATEHSAVARNYFTANLAITFKENNITGSVAEAGVYKGGFSHFITRFFGTSKIYLFDTFESFDSRDISTIKDPKAKIWTDRFYKDFADTSEFIATLSCFNRQNVVIKKGYVPDTFAGLEDEHFCFVNLDMDLYTPQLEALKYFCPRMVDGGVILIHDYFDPYLGSDMQKAVNEVEKDFKFKIFPIGDGCSIALIF
jgi:hypothetical protein